jgi:DNA (cytosine-5)-methyltransferase 1
MQFAFADLFCGAGLFSASWAKKFRPVHAVDLDGDAIRTYNQNVARVAEVGNACIVGADVRCDILVAGPPCQGFSTLGRRNPADARNALSSVVPRWAATTDAAIVVVENVPPFVESTHWQQMRDGLDRLGYELTVWTLDAVNFGCAQRRKRSFTIGSKIGLPVEPQPTHIRRPRTVAEAFSEPPIKPNDPMHIWPIHSELSMRRITLVPRGGDKRDLIEIAPDLCPPSWFRLHDQATDVFGRIDPNQPANTLRCEFQNPSKGRYLHPSENRTLSLREGSRLQGLPDEWEFVGGPVSVQRQIGNGVPIELGDAVVRSIAELVG